MKRLSGFGRSAGRMPGVVDPDHIAGEEETRVRMHLFDEGATDVSEAPAVEDLKRGIAGSRMCWIRVMGLRDTALIQTLCDGFGLHPLLFEDIFNRFQRPKLELEDSFILASLNAVREGNGTQAGNPVHVSVLLCGTTVVTFEEREIGLLGQVEQRISTNQGRIRRSEPDYLFYAVLDAIVDGYFTALEAISDMIEELEERISSDPGHEVLESIHRMRTRMLLFRKSVWPLREVISELAREETSLTTRETVAYFRDLYENTIQVIDTTETLRDILAGMIDTYLSSISNRMNKVMQVLTIVATIFIPLTFVAGVYGMNFHFMPELSYTWGYPAVLFLMFCMAMGMLLYFRRKKWL
jgi:magnesium transporter